MRSGSLRHTITFQQITVSNDTWGHSSETWTSTIKDVPAAIWPISAREYTQNAGLKNELSHRIRIRYRSGLHPKMRIKFGTRYFNIVSMINFEERNKYYDIMAVEDV